MTKRFTVIPRFTHMYRAEFGTGHVHTGFAVKDHEYSQVGNDPAIASIPALAYDMRIENNAHKLAAELNRANDLVSRLGILRAAKKIAGVVYELCDAILSLQMERLADTDMSENDIRISIGAENRLRVERAKIDVRYNAMMMEAKGSQY